MRALILLVLMAGALVAQDRRFDLLIVGGTLIDGTGVAPRKADVGVRGGRIVEIGALTHRDATRTIDAAGLVVAPGFIDVHAHADGQAVTHADAASFLTMGVTTIVTGNCGGSVRNIAEHFEKLEKSGIGVNYGTLVGHGTIRREVMGSVDRAPTTDELERMVALLARGLNDGAFGMSTGLIYVPGTYAKTDELVTLSRIVQRHGGVYASHMRDESDKVLIAIEEALKIGRQAGVRVHLSHLKSAGKNNWGGGKRIIARLAEARASGVRVTGDQYAYTASSTSLDVLFPARELQIMRAPFAKKLATDDAFRKRMHAALLETMDASGFGDFGYCQIAYAPNNAALSGKTLKQAAKVRLGRDDRDSQARVAIDLFIESKGRRISMVYHKMCEEDVETIMRAPFVAVACDAGIRVRSMARPHPRGSGNNARVLSRYVRDRKVIPLELAVRKMSSLPAEVFSIEGRGSIKVGAWADCVLFDPEKVRDRATYEDPFESPDGIPWVIVNGRVAVANGKPNGTRAGQVLRHRRSEEDR